MILNLKTAFIVSLSMFLFTGLCGQNRSVPENIKKRVIGLTPSNKHIIVSGLAIGLTAHPWSTWEDTLYVKVNGLNIEVGPLGIIGGIWGTMFGLGGVRDSSNKKMSFFTNNNYPDTSGYEHVKYGTKINGVSISLGGITETFNSGLIINGLSGICYETKGVQISGLLNSMYEFRGILIAGITNNTKRGKGLQIALINNCGSGQVFQIGLFNRIGKKVRPFINFNFKKEK
jgi:hypothetical protein